MLSLIISLLVAAFFGWFNYYFFLPAMNPASAGFWLWLIVTYTWFYVCLWLTGFLDNKKIFTTRDSRNMAKYLTTIILATPVVLLVIFSFSGAKIFHASAYSKVATVETANFSDLIIQSDKVDDIALMDTETARYFGERALGELETLVSVYDVEEQYTTIALKGKPMKVSSLRYDSFFKYLKNKESGIPGYMMVDPVNNTAKYIPLENTIKYAPSACFSYDLYRTLRFYDPTAIYGATYFEVDEDGIPFWVTPVLRPTIGMFAGRVIDGAVITDAATGKCTYYELSEIPTWVDIVYDGDMISTWYNWKGTLSNGYWNSWFAQTGCTQTTDDFGYKVIGEDVYIYTGITSCNSNASAIAFLLANSRTGQMVTMQLAGADEHSAMDAAMGEVSDYGWVASFPSIVNINGEPAYLMVLKDESNIVKRYALVNIKSYNIVAVDTTQKKVLAKYVALLNGEDEETAQEAADEVVETKEEVIPDTVQEKEIVIGSIEFIVNGGDTTCYIKDIEGNVYKMPFDEALMLTNPGDTLNITYDPGTISKIYKIN